MSPPQAHPLLHATSHQSLNSHLILKDVHYNTRFGFVIFRCTEFGVSSSQVVLRCVLGFLAGKCRAAVSPTSSILLSHAIGSLAVGHHLPPWDAILMPVGDAKSPFEPTRPTFSSHHPPPPRIPNTPTHMQQPLTLHATHRRDLFPQKTQCLQHVEKLHSPTEPLICEKCNWMCNLLQKRFGVWCLRNNFLNPPPSLSCA